VSSLVPDGYEAYGRILHPARRTDKPGKLRWSAIADERGGAIGPEVHFTALVGWVPARDGQSAPEPYVAPAWGTMEDDECARLAELLARFTSTPERCWFCLWEGYGWPELPRQGQGPPRVNLPHRDCILFSGPVDVATSFRSPPWSQPPTLWWPDDRAWCVASEIEGYSSCIAASGPCIEALVEDALELVVTSPDYEVDPSPFWVSSADGPAPVRDSGVAVAGGYSARLVRRSASRDIRRSGAPAAPRPRCSACPFWTALDCHIGDAQTAGDDVVRGGADHRRALAPSCSSSGSNWLAANTGSYPALHALFRLSEIPRPRDERRTATGLRWSLS
jgi:hypothetical protein